jgi:hypothetical protein
MPVAVYLLKAGDYQAAITDITQYSIMWCAASVTQEWLLLVLTAVQCVCRLLQALRLHIS